MQFTSAKIIAGNEIALTNVSGEIRDSGAGTWNGKLECPDSPDAIGLLFGLNKPIYLDIAGRVKMKIAVKNQFGEFTVG